MPGIFDFITNPMVPQRAIQGLQKVIDPGTTSNPIEGAIRGFGAGALEGLRGMTTPMDAASVAFPALRAAKPFLRGAKPLVTAPAKVASMAEQAGGTTMSEVDALIEQLGQRLPEIPTSKTLPRPQRQQIDPKEILRRQGEAQLKATAIDQLQQGLGNVTGEYAINEDQQDPRGLAALRERFLGMFR